MPKNKQFFKDIICVEKGSGEDIYAFTDICIESLLKYTQEATNTCCFPGEEMNGGQQDTLSYEPYCIFEFQTI